MFSVFLELVKRVGIFMIIGQTILHFGISRVYEKYMKLVISFMVAAQVVFSFGAYLQKEDKAATMWSLEEYYKTWDRSMAELGKALEQRQEELTGGLLKRMEEEMTKSETTREDMDRIEIESIRIQ